MSIEWKPIADAPRDGSRVIVTDRREFASAEWTNGRWIKSPSTWEGDDRGGLADVEFSPTEWMVPSLPEGAPAPAAPEPVNKGIAIGGPMDGKELEASAEASRLSIPFQQGANAAGRPVFGLLLYHWNGFNWIFGEATKH